MLQPVEIVRPSPHNAMSSLELEVNIDNVLKGKLPGFVISSSMPNAFKHSVQRAVDIGLVGGINTSSMTFNYDATVSGLAAARTNGRAPGPEEWEQFGITSLHADGEEGDEMISISKARLGSYTINVLQRGPARKEDMPIELWDSLQEENTRLLLEGVVDTQNLMPAMTSFNVSAGDTVIFNPSHPHMGITTQAPRRTDTTFFSKA